MVLYPPGAMGALLPYPHRMKRQMQSCMVFIGRTDNSPRTPDLQGF